MLGLTKDARISPSQKETGLSNLNFVAVSSAPIVGRSTSTMLCNSKEAMDGDDFPGQALPDLRRWERNWEPNKETHLAWMYQ